MSKRIPAAIIGATGYVGGELLRLLATHPVFDLQAAVSTSRAGSDIGATFPTLASVYKGQTFCSIDDCLSMLQQADEFAVFSAAPHGASAAVVARIISAADAAGTTVHCVDSSADFRYPTAAAYEQVYGQPHGAPELLPLFQQGLPEHVTSTDCAHVGHPGCFATAAMLAAVPLCQQWPAVENLFINGITGSTGSGSSPLPGTHHPERHSNLYAYKPLAHRHAPEISAAIALAGATDTRVNFVPHSGPFARGIHVTLQATLNHVVTADVLLETYQKYYRDSEFVIVVEATPRIKNVVASNYAHIGVAAEGQNVVVFCAIDNIVKGAAGGAVQWMNRLWSLATDSGLRGATPAWT